MSTSSSEAKNAPSYVLLPYSNNRSLEELSLYRRTGGKLYELRIVESEEILSENKSYAHMAHLTNWNFQEDADNSVAAENLDNILAELSALREMVDGVPATETEKQLEFRLQVSEAHEQHLRDKLEEAQLQIKKLTAQLDELKK